MRIEPLKRTLSVSSFGSFPLQQIILAAMSVASMRSFSILIRIVPSATLYTVMPPRRSSSLSVSSFGSLPLQLSGQVFIPAHAAKASSDVVELSVSSFGSFPLQPAVQIDGATMQRTTFSILIRIVPSATATSFKRRGGLFSLSRRDRPFFWLLSAFFLVTFLLLSIADGSHFRNPLSAQKQGGVSRK